MDRVLVTVNQLMVLLEHSLSKNALLMQNQFKLQNLTSNKEILCNFDSKTFINSFQILRCSCGDLIGTLPQLKTIDDVLRLKDKRKNDIVRLRAVLNEFDFLLKTGSKDSAIRKITSDINIASNELSWGNQAGIVSKWITYLAIPISIIKLLYDLPPIAGMTLNTIGTGTTLGSEIAKKRSQWIQVIR